MGIAVGLFWLTAVGCSAVLRYPTGVLPSDFDESDILGRRMNRDVLSLDRFRHLIVEVDWVETAAPADLALAALHDTLVEFAPAEYEITIETGDEIPLESWESVRNESFPNTLLTEYVNRLPWREAAHASLYVLYLPDLPEGHPANFGYFAHAEAKRANSSPATADSVSLPLIVLSKGAFRRWALLWLEPEQIERGTLVHELGHFLGLVSNPRHEPRDDPMHCANPACPMSHPRWRSILRNAGPGLLGRLPFEYGDDCRRDIELAKASWQSESSYLPGAAVTE